MTAGPTSHAGHHQATLYEKPGRGTDAPKWWRVSCSCGWGTPWYLAIPIAEWRSHFSPGRCRRAHRRLAGGRLKGGGR